MKCFAGVYPPHSVDQFHVLTNVVLNWGLILIAFMSMLLMIFFTIRPKLLAGIPEVPSPLMFGMADDLLPIGKNLDSHMKIHQICEKFGPIVQFRMLNELIILINDPQLYKIAFDNVKSKGRLQVSYHI